MDAPETVDRAIAQMLISLDKSVDLLGFGEALHGGEQLLFLRNQLFQRLVERYGYSAIALESSFPKAHLVNDYILGRVSVSYEEIQNAGFSQGIGQIQANRALVEWMRHYNADPAHPVKLHFYGFTGIASPRDTLHVAVKYLSSLDSISGHAHGQAIESFLGEDAEWENPAAHLDPARLLGLSPAATALRLATEELILELRMRQPELVANSDLAQYTEALQHAIVARQILTYYAAQARQAGRGQLLGIRDLLMADNLIYILERERERGRVLAFAHNAHLQRGKATVWPSWQQVLGTNRFAWWPAGAHLAQRLGSHYAVIGSAVGVSESHGIVQPEAETLEDQLMAERGALCFIPTHQGQGLPPAEVAALPTRSGSKQNLTYVTLTAQSLTDFDYLAFFPSLA